MKTAIATAAFLCILPGLASAGYPNAIAFGPSYAIGPPLGSPWWALPAVGSPIAIFGLVSDLGAPFADLPPASPYEITLVFEGATCSGTGNFDGPCTGGNFVTYQGGTLTLYLDTTPDADFTNTATFRDGELVLAADVEFLYVADSDPGEACPGMDDDEDVPAYFSFSGGSWFDRVASHGQGLAGISKGELTGHNPNNVPAALQALGYVLRIDGTVDIFGPVAVTPTTWGRVKALYR